MKRSSGMLALEEESVNTMLELGYRLHTRCERTRLYRFN
jgi:hypothetical protein